MNVKHYIVELYGFNVSEYLKYMNKSTVINGLANSTSIIYHGWTMITQLIALLHQTKHTKQQIHHLVTRAYYMYTEYVEQIHIKHMCEQHSPSIFVYNQIVGDICLKNDRIVQYNHTIPSFVKIIKWSEILLLWNNPHFTFEHRLLCSETFLYSYLTVLCSEQYHNSFRLLEILQDYWKDKVSYVEMHIRIMHAFLSRIQLNHSKNIYSIENVKKQCFYLFVQYHDETQEKIQNTIASKNVDDLISWLLTVRNI